MQWKKVGSSPPGSLEEGAGAGDVVTSFVLVPQKLGEEPRGAGTQHFSPLRRRWVRLILRMWEKNKN